MKKRPDGLYRKDITVTERGKKVRRTIYGKTVAEINRKMIEYREREEAGELFGTVSDEWWEDAEPSIAYNTTKSYKPALRRAKEHFGETPIKDIKPTDISRFLRDFIRKTNAADKTARTQLMVISLICRYGVENGYIDSNPARDVSVPSGLKKKKRLMPSQKDIDAVKASAGCTFGMFPYWLMYTGCRKGELLALRWEDVDFRAKTISIYKSVYHVNNRPMIKEPKTESGIRTLPLMKDLEKKIRKGTGYIFHNGYGGLLTEDQYIKLWNTYKEESGTDFTAHQLRHAFATLLIENGIEPTDAQYLLGHAQLSTTMDVYREYREGQQKKARDRVRDLTF